MALFQLQAIGHEAHDEGLRDGLAAVDGQRLVGIGLIEKGLLDEEFARYLLDGFQNPHVAHALVSQGHDQGNLAGIGGHGVSSAARTASIASTCVRLRCSGVTEMRLLKAAQRSVPMAGLPRSRLKPSQ